MNEDELEKYFSDSLKEQNQLVRTISVHLDVEYWVNELIDLMMPAPEKLKPIGLDYFGKVHLLVALGMNENFKNPLLYLGRIRNKFAHNISFSIDKSVVNNFYKEFSEDDKGVVQKVFVMNKKGANKKAFAAYDSFKDMSIDEQFILYSLAVRNMVKGSVFKIRNGSLHNDIRETKT